MLSPILRDICIITYAGQFLGRARQRREASSFAAQRFFAVSLRPRAAATRRRPALSLLPKHP
jgi:hypothetical protein